MDYPNSTPARPQNQVPSFEPLPDGRYRAHVGTIERGDGKFGPSYRWKFTLTDHDRSLIAWTSTDATERSKYWRWCKAVLALPEYVRPHDVDPALLIGRPVILEVVLGEGERGTYSRIRELYPVESQQPELFDDLPGEVRR